MKRALFLDRDGIVNEVVMRDGVVSSPRTIKELELIPGADDFIQKVKQLGFLTILVTNQPDVARKKMSRYQLNQMHKKIREWIPIDHIEVCMSGNDNCFRRKPNPGMLLQSARRFDIDLTSSFFLGDSHKDVLAGKRAGVQTILYQTDYNTNHHGMADFNCTHFEQIFELLRDRWNLQQIT